MKSIFTFLFLFSLCGIARATDYYVSPTGNNLNDGQTQLTPWQTLSKVSSTTFQPGDRILLQAGGTWSGQLSPLGSGIFGSPIIIDMYGTGNKPIINAPGTDQSAGVLLSNQSYWEINNLEITNTQTSGGTARLCGVLVKAASALPGIYHVYVQNCYVHDVNSLSNESNTNFSKGTGGIFYTGVTNEILVKGCHVANVAVTGIRNSSDPIKCSHFVIDSCVIENTYGDGIVYHGVNNHSAITRNVLRNTCYNTSSANYAGAWTYLSDTTLVAYNEVSGITGGGGNDGQPFDADISTNGDIFEYNYSHDNAKGFMLFMPSAQNIIVRYNLSVNDIGNVSNNKRLFNYTVTTNNNNSIYNNTFYINANTVSQIFQTGFIGNFSNNIIYCTGTVNQFSANAVSASSTFYNNCIYPQSVTSVNGPAGSVAGNIYLDPMFVTSGFNGPGLSGGAQNAYALSTTSPCLKSGIVINANGGYDFAGTNITNNVYATIGAIWPANAPTWITKTIPIQEDTYTYDGSAGTNYGTAASLQSKFGGGFAPEGTTAANGYSRRTYLKFANGSMDTISNLSKILLRVRYYNKDQNYSVNGTKVSLSRLSTWSETGITWSSQNTDGGALDSLGYTLDDGSPKPSSVPSPITDSYINGSTHYMYLNVTDTILKMIKAHTLPTNLSFVLQGICSSIIGPNGSTPIGNTGYTYFSKEFTNTNGQTVDSLSPTLLVYSTSAPLANASNVYYIDPNGNDLNDGLSAATAWQTLNKVSTTTFSPGDKILFLAGGVWNGQLAPQGSGSFGIPITIDQYGSGANPVINGSGASNSALQLTNQSYWEINNLEITNNNSTASGLSGILITNGNQAQQHHVFINNCYVHDVVSSVSGTNKLSGGIVFSGPFDSAVVNQCHLKNVAEEGIRFNSATSGTTGFNTNATIKNNVVENVWGDGILLSAISMGGIIDGNHLINCSNSGTNTYVGIGVANSTGSVVQNNEVNDQVGGQAAGEAFSDDSTSSKDIFQYNYSHNNTGGLLWVSSAATGFIFRFNLSQNDGNGQEIFRAGNNANTANQLYNNTIYLGSGLSTNLFSTASTNGTLVNFYNNIIDLNGATLSAFSSNALSAQSQFNGNCFYPQSNFSSATNYFTTQQALVGTDPQFTNPGTGSNGFTTTTGYQLQTSSSCLASGVIISNNGGLDFAKNNIAGRRFLTIGAIWPATEPQLSQLNIKTIADAYTYDGSKASNYGTATNLVSKFGGGYAPEGTTTANGYSRRTYLKFSTASLASVSGVQKIYVRTRYYAKDNNYNVDGIKVSLSRNAAWSETGITWNSQATDGGVLDSVGYALDDGSTKPASAPNPMTDAFINASSRYMYLDVTDTILKMIANSTLPTNLSFVLQGICTSITGANGSTPVGNTGYTYFSKEFTNTNGQTVDSLAPTLVVYTSSTTIMPVKSSPLAAHLINNHTAQLNWTTSYEQNIKQYVIEKSTDGASFTTIANVPAYNKGNESIVYTYADNNIVSGITFYRWREQDLDGSFATISNIAQVNNNGANNSLVIYPNPVKSGSNITLRLAGIMSGDAKIQFTDAQGRLIRSSTLPLDGTNYLQVPTAGLNSGIYFITIVNGATTQYGKLIIQ